MELELGDRRNYIGVLKAVLPFSELRNVGVSLALQHRIRRKFQPIVFSLRFPFNFASFVISLSPFFDLVRCNFPF